MPVLAGATELSIRFANVLLTSSLGHVRASSPVTLVPSQHLNPFLRKGSYPRLLRRQFKNLRTYGTNVSKWLASRV